MVKHMHYAYMNIKHFMTKTWVALELLLCWIYFKKNANTSSFYHLIILRYLMYLDADSLMTQGARVSTAMAVSKFSWNILVSAPEGLNSQNYSWGPIY